MDPATAFERKVDAFVRRERLWMLGARILVACSGGPDSLALLWWLLARRRRDELTVRAVYVHHHLRTAADEEARYLTRIGGEQGFAVEIRHVDVPERIKATGESTETAARTLRYRTLRAAAAEAGDDRIAVAHHADDQAETILHHILRGTGMRGLRGMLPQTGRIVRPLLEVTRAEVEAYLAACCPYAPCIDETNTDTGYLRNALRHEVLPYLVQYNPNIREGLCRLGALMRDETEWTDALTAAWWDREATVADGKVSLPRPMKWPLALCRHVVREVYRRYGTGTPDGGQTQRVVDLWRAGRTGARYVARGLYWEVAADRMTARNGLVVTDKQAMSAAAGETGILTLGERQVTVRRSDYPDGEINVPIRTLQGPLRLRYRRPGDRIAVPRVGTKKWKDWLIDHKVPRGDRDSIVVLADDTRIYHAFGYWRGSEPPDEPGPYWAIGDRRRMQDEGTD